MNKLNMYNLSLYSTTSKNIPFNVSQQETPTLNYCWQKSRNVIVSYDYPKISSSKLWGKITYFYGDTMDPAKVESILQQILETKKPSNCKFYVSMLHCVEDTFVC